MGKPICAFSNSIYNSRLSHERPPTGWALLYALTEVISPLICVYPADCTDFSNNGLGAVTPMSCSVTETLNGEWELTLVHDIDEFGKWTRLSEGRILRAPVPAAMTPRVNQVRAQPSGGAMIYRVATRRDPLRLRSGTGTKYRILGKYKKGTQVVVLEKTTADWYEVSCPDGKRGYMAAQYLTYVRTESAPAAAVSEVVEPKMLRDQPFRIYRVVPELDKITVYARHIFYDLLDNMIQSLKPSSSQTGASVVQSISAACLSEHGFTFYSDLESTAKEVEWENINPVEALLGEGGAAEKYSGELARDWFDVYLVQRVGTDTNVQIRQGKNLLGISYDVDGTNVTTRILPTGEDADGNRLYLPERYVDSPNLDRYPSPKWMHLEVSGAKEVKKGEGKKTKAQCYEEMRSAAQAEFDKGCDLPTVTLKVDFINCADTEEYRQYGFLQNIFLGDAVRVLVKKLGISVSMRMTQYAYDCLTRRYTSVTLGTVADTLEGNTISSRQLPAGIITGSKLAINSVGAGQLQSGSVGSLQIQMAAIQTAHIETAAITSAIERENADHSAYQLPPVSFLRAGKKDQTDATEEIRFNRDRLDTALSSFGVNATIRDVTRGPTVTRYDLELEAGVKLNKITNLSGDLALALGVENVRIAPIPDKISTVGIEVPNKIVSAVCLRDIIDSPAFRNAKSKLSFAVGKDIGGNCIIGNISKLPHMLIAGTTGSGKSVCMNSLILSLLYKATPDEVRLIMIDPKMVELGIYNGIPHLFIPVVTDPKKAAGALQWAVVEMLKRYRLFSEAQVRDLASYNALQKNEPDGQTLPQVVIVIDELADLMLCAAKEVEESICRVAQMGRAAGMHLIIATQRPSADVITGLMKANIPSRIAFAVSSSLESRIILDTSGAEKLIGMGDMLYAPIGTGKPLRVQGSFVSDEEREEVVRFIKQNSEAQYSDDIIAQIEKSAAEADKKSGPAPEADKPAKSDYDELLPQGVDVILETKQASVSMLQRRLKLGYSRAARMVDQMEEMGIVGPFEGSKPRKILITKEQWQEMQYVQGTAPSEVLQAQTEFADANEEEPEDDES